jgi:CRP-like cAMP-binding protein
MDGNEVLLTTLGPGDTVGEMAIITSQPRSATVVAREDTQVEVLTLEQIRSEMKKLAPWMERIVDGLAHRLHDTSTRVHPLLSGNCLYNVTNQLVLILDLSCRGTGDGCAVCDLPMAAVVKRIALDLALPSDRIVAVLEALAAFDQVDVRDDGTLRVADLARLHRLADYCRDVVTSDDPATVHGSDEFGPLYSELIEMTRDDAW